LDISIVVLASPDIASITLDAVGDHIINQSVLIPQLLAFKLLLVLLLIYFLENVLKAPVISLQDGVLS
jgi:hypothetical protein